MARFFQRNKSVVSRHISNVFRTGELSRESTVAKFAQVALDGKKRVMDFYNLDMIIKLS